MRIVPRSIAMPAALLLTAATAPVVAQQQQQQQQTMDHSAHAGHQAAAPAAAKADAVRKICRTERPSGSRMHKRVCHTQAEWSRIDAASQGGRDLERTRRN